MLLAWQCTWPYGKTSRSFNEVKVQQLDPANGNKDVGDCNITESNYGLVFTPNLQGLAEGLHGFHIHENPSCDPKEKDGKLTAGLAAGGHWDPKGAKQHGYPWQDDAHLGDLPALTVLHDGTATNPVLAPRLKKIRWSSWSFYYDSRGAVITTQIIQLHLAVAAHVWHVAWLNKSILKDKKCGQFGLHFVLKLNATSYLAISSGLEHS